MSLYFEVEKGSELCITFSCFVHSLHSLFHIFRIFRSVFYQMTTFFSTMSTLSLHFHLTMNIERPTKMKQDWKWMPCITNINRIVLRFLYLFSFNCNFSNKFFSTFQWRFLISFTFIFLRPLFLSIHLEYQKNVIVKTNLYRYVFEIDREREWKKQTSQF